MALGVGRDFEASLATSMASRCNVTVLPVPGSPSSTIERSRRSSARRCFVRRCSRCSRRSSRSNPRSVIDRSPVITENDGGAGRPGSFFTLIGKLTYARGSHARSSSLSIVKERKRRSRAWYCPTYRLSSVGRRRRMIRYVLCARNAPTTTQVVMIPRVLARKSGKIRSSNFGKSIWGTPTSILTGSGSRLLRD